MWSFARGTLVERCFVEVGLCMLHKQQWDFCTHYFSPGEILIGGGESWVQHIGNQVCFVTWFPTCWVRSWLFIFFKTLQSIWIHDDNFFIKLTLCFALSHPLPFKIVWWVWIWRGLMCMSTLAPFISPSCIPWHCCCCQLQTGVHYTNHVWYSQ